MTLPPPQDSLIEHTALGDVGAVVPETVDGLIDSRLFGAYVPEGVDAPPIEGLETTQVAQVTIMDDKVPELEATSFIDQPVAEPNFADAGPLDGLIDSRLFGAYVPDGVDAPMLEGLEITRFDADEMPKPKASARRGDKVADGDFEGYCPGCAVNVKSRMCPQCGNPARPRGW
ncbi:MAG: hypothetical protein ABIJ09_07095 [Pseudomonadota bacterium]